MMNNVYGIGTDILLMKRIQSLLSHEKNGAFFLQKTYTDKERESIASTPEFQHRYATHFCAKEAVFKALSLDSNFPFKWNQIEILYKSSGKPYVSLHGKVAEASEKKGIRKVLVSISYDGEYATAYAAALL